ncbi:unnamed protein product [Brugia pahangi]|uniref:WD_REPEATS_REGION domain-containing protein n=1 Tax=Brugia pahangi TaxID=6280 RepID=A0A0N4T523_BRUPA|nr:unnamed protein product [Brugia pahangi]
MNRACRVKTVLSHHTGCSPTSLESLKELGNDSKATSCEVYLWKFDSMKALFIDRSNEQNWDTTVTDEILMHADIKQQSFFFMQFLQVLI